MGNEEKNNAEQSQNIESSLDNNETFINLCRELLGARKLRKIGEEKIERARREETRVLQKIGKLVGFKNDKHPDLLATERPGVDAAILRVMLRLENEEVGGETNYCSI